MLALPFLSFALPWAAAVLVGHTDKSATVEGSLSGAPIAADPLLVFRWGTAEWLRRSAVRLECTEEARKLLSLLITDVPEHDKEE